MGTFHGVPGGSGLPALANDEITSTRELNGVSVAGRLEVDVAVGLVVLVVVLTAHQTVSGNLKVGSIGVGIGGRGSVRASDG
jgi:hypothetical protein